MHVAVFPVPAHGHMNPICTVASELKKRGHKVTLVSIHGFAETYSKKFGLEHKTIGTLEEANQIKEMARQMSGCQDLEALSMIMKTFEILITMFY